MTIKTSTPQADTLRSQIARYLDTVADASRDQIAKAAGRADYPGHVVKELNAMRTDGDVECEQQKGEMRYWLAKPLAEILGAGTPSTSPARTLPEGIREGTRMAQVYGVLSATPRSAEEIAHALKQPKSTIAPVLSLMHNAGTAQREQGADGLYRYTRPRSAPAAAHPEKAAPSMSAAAPSIAAQKAPHTAAGNERGELAAKLAATEGERDELQRGLAEAQSAIGVRARQIGELEAAVALHKEYASDSARRIAELESALELRQACAKVDADKILETFATIASLEAHLAAERQARAALQAQLDNLPDITDETQGFLVRAPKRKPRIVTKAETAVGLAKAAARNGSGRGDVYALVHLGTARRDAVYREAT